MYVMPSHLPREVAVSLTYRGLMAYRAVTVAKDLVKSSHNYKTAIVIGSHGLGLWTVQTAYSLIAESDKMRWVIADTSAQAEEYVQAAYHNNFSTFDLLNWPPNCYEQDLIEKTRRACSEKVDLVFDYSGQARVAKRMTGLLNDDCVVVTVGDPKVWPIPSSGRAVSCGYVNEGDLRRLPELVQLLSKGDLRAPRLVPLSKLSLSEEDEDQLNNTEGSDAVF